MTLRGASRRYFAELVEKAPYREPPAGATAPLEPGRVGRVAWPLACAAALALMLLVPPAPGSGVGREGLGPRFAATLESEVLSELGTRAMEAIVAGSPFAR